MFRIVRARNVKPTKPKYSIRAHIFFDLAFFFFVLSLYFQYGILSNYIVGYLSLSLWFRLIRNSLGSISIAYPSILLPVIVRRHQEKYRQKILCCLYRLTAKNDCLLPCIYRKLKVQAVGTVQMQIKSIHIFK